MHDDLPSAIHEVAGQGGCARPRGPPLRTAPGERRDAGRGLARPALGLGAARMRLTPAHHGNTGGASVPVTLDLAHRRGVFTEGDLTVLSAFGADGGMSVGSALLHCAPTRHARPSRHHFDSHVVTPVAHTPAAPPREPAPAGAR
nr:3-oxoacyl-[acyl-carrier-protein] synthase III C-terminal domain-containing protein [Streptomyces carpinensis]